MGTGSFLGVKCGWGVLLTPHLHLMCRGPRKIRAIPLLTLGVFEAYKMGEHLPTSFNSHRVRLVNMVKKIRRYSSWGFPCQNSTRQLQAYRPESTRWISEKFVSNMCFMKWNRDSFFPNILVFSLSIIAPPIFFIHYAIIREANDGPTKSRISK